MLPVRHSSEGFDDGVANLDRIGGRLSQTALHDLQDYLLNCIALCRRGKLSHCLVGY